MLHTIKLSCIVILSTALWGCNSLNDAAPTANVSGKHTEANWVASGHRVQYRANPAGCMECHGADLKGGSVSKVDCFNQGGLTTCHSNGHAPRLPNHAIPFTERSLHGVAALRDIQACQLCHGTTGGAGSNPRFNVVIGALTVGCEAAGCHLTGQPSGAATNLAHPKPWNDHKTAGNQSNACPLCHGTYLTGGTQASGTKAPSCGSCHLSLQEGTVPRSGSCSSCHSTPPGNTVSEAVSPNRAGSHLVHMSLPELTNTVAACQYCHRGGGSGTALHQSYHVATLGNYTTHPLIGFPPAFSEGGSGGTCNRTGSTVTCSNIKCHGGQTTPPWGSANGIDCSDCHTLGSGAGVPTHTSYYSGKHYYHLVSPQKYGCRDCHTIDIAVSGRHFSNLSSARFNQLPADTLKATIGFNPTTKSCTAPISGCHGGTSKIW